MGPVLNGMIKLQSVENRLRAVNSKIARCRRSVIFQENQIRTLQSNIEAKQEEIKLTKVQVDRLELDLKSRDEHIAKMRAALNTAKSNKEYSVILTDLNTSKADNSKLENQVLELMNNIEADNAVCAETQTQIDEQKEKLAELRKEAEEKTAKFEEERVQVQAQWDEAAHGIPEDALKVFARVAETYDGEALAEVEMTDEKALVYSCGGCFMGLPAEHVNQLMMKDEIIRCTSCTRILILKSTNDE